MKELLEIVHALGVVIEQLKGHAYGVAGMELAQIAHVHLGGVAGVLARLDVVEAAADELERLVHRAVEQHVVVGHVEMAVVVDPAGLDPHQRGDEGGEEYGFEIVPVEHGKNSGLISKRFLARFGRSNKRPRRGRGPDSSLGIFGCGGSRLPSACQINSAGAKGFPKGCAKSHNGMTALRVPESDMEN